MGSLPFNSLLIGQIYDQRLGLHREGLSEYMHVGWQSGHECEEQLELNSLVARTWRSNGQIAGKNFAKHILASVTCLTTGEGSGKLLGLKFLRRAVPFTPATGTSAYGSFRGWSMDELRLEREQRKFVVAKWHTLRGEEGRERIELIWGL